MLNHGLLTPSFFLGLPALTVRFQTFPNLDGITLADILCHRDREFTPILSAVPQGSPRSPARTFPHEGNQMSKPSFPPTADRKSSRPPAAATNTRHQDPGLVLRHTERLKVFRLYKKAAEPFRNALGTFPQMTWNSPATKPRKVLYRLTRRNPAAIPASRGPNAQRPVEHWLEHARNKKTAG